MPTRRRSLLPAFFAITLGFAGGAAPPAALAAQPACAPAVGTTTAPSGLTSPADNAAFPCWVDVTPYPFGSDGERVDTSDRRCAPTAGGDALACYLTVTSLAFRSWNRGVAATEPATGRGDSGAAYGVWIFNGTRWVADSGFPGQRTCPGDTVVWAGALDYWLVGAGSQNWPSLCRFNGAENLWEPMSLPKATLARVTSDPAKPPAPGGITSAACFAWDNCWFFGSYGARVRWDGSILKDASADISQQPWLAGQATAAYAGRDASGAAFGLATGGTGATTRTSGPVPAQPDGSSAPVLFASRGSAFSPLPFAPPTSPRPDDPSRTDLVALGFNPEGQGWVAGNPAGFRARFTDLDDKPDQRYVSPQPEPAPLVPLSPTGGETPACSGPSPTHFTYTRFTSTADTFLWSALGVLPGSGTAIAGGRVRPPHGGTDPNDDGSAEPVLARVDCDGTSTTLRFRSGDPTTRGAQAPADRQGSITAVAVNTANDAWAATTRGVLGRGAELVSQRPHLYRLTGAGPPTAPPGADGEQRPLNLKQDAPIVVEVPDDTPAPAPAAATSVTTTRNVRLQAAVYGVRTQLHGTTLYLTFRVRRPVKVGAEALRGRRVVSRARMRRFASPRGTLKLRLQRKHWPTRIRFVTPKADASIGDVGTGGPR